MNGMPQLRAQSRFPTTCNTARARDTATLKRLGFSRRNTFDPSGRSDPTQRGPLTDGGLIRAANWQELYPTARAAEGAFSIRQAPGSACRIPRAPAQALG